ncbi:MAG: glycosyltransferase family 4 protein [Acidaminococcaceae bacterium]
MAILNLSTYLPQQCGIATFSTDLRKSLLPQGQKFEIMAISDRENGYDYPNEVAFKLYKHNKEDYIRAAEFANTHSDFDLVVVQHEYGIFGGPDGNYLLDFISHLHKPFIVITHSVLPKPSQGQHYILRELCRQAAGIVCMTNKSAHLLHEFYAAPADLISVIHHGVPLFQNHPQEELKQKYNFKNNQLVTTFGLIGPGKGLEIGIRAMAKVALTYPSVRYLILGKTHPNLLHSEGESYRNMLLDLVKDLDLENNIIFVNKFLSDDELGDYLHMTDIYLSPYPNRDQAVSGTMAFALGCGRAIVSTAYAYAEEVLANERGLLAQSNDPAELASLLSQILDNRQLQQKLENNAADFGKTITWPNIGKNYCHFINKTLENYRRISQMR